MVSIVRFLNPTANKALHLGHLRNAVWGMAQAARAAEDGEPVIRHVLIKDAACLFAEACLAAMGLGLGEARPRLGKIRPGRGDAYVRQRAGEPKRRKWPNGPQPMA